MERHLGRRDVQDIRLVSIRAAPMEVRFIYWMVGGRRVRTDAGIASRFARPRGPSHADTRLLLLARLRRSSHLEAAIMEAEGRSPSPPRGRVRCWIHVPLEALATHTLTPQPLFDSRRWNSLNTYSVLGPEGLMEPMVLACANGKMSWRGSEGGPYTAG